MGRERQKKKSRSSLQKVKPTLRGRTKAGKIKVNFAGNAIIADNWDRKLTLSQNYKRLGLSSRLNVATGGIEQKSRNLKTTASSDDSLLAVPKGRKTGKIEHEEVRVERDPETGRILRVVRPEGKDEPLRPEVLIPLDDPLNDLVDVEEDAVSSQKPTGVVAQLEAEAEQEGIALARKKRPRQQSQREEEWISQLVQKYGTDYSAMSRDRKLNPMQQSAGDLARRAKKWVAKSQKAG